MPTIFMQTTIRKPTIVDRFAYGKIHGICNGKNHQLCSFVCRPLEDVVQHALLSVKKGFFSILHEVNVV